MASIDDAFLDFLKAYGHTSSLNALDTDKVSESRVNAIFTRHKSAFDAWMKCPRWLKEKYLGKIPYDILEKAAADPNFTDADAARADAEHQKKENPYSAVPESVIQHPAYEQLCSCGAKLTPAHIALMKLTAETYARGGYSVQNAENIGMEYAFRKAYLDRRKELMKDSNLFEKERNEQIKILDEQHTASRQRELKAKEAEIERHPEKAVIRLLWKMQKEHRDLREATFKIGTYIRDIVATDKLVLLAEEMTTAKYQKQTNAASKEFLLNMFVKNGVDLSHLNQMTQDLIADDTQKQNTAVSHSERFVQPYIKQQINSQRTERGR